MTFSRVYTNSPWEKEVGYCRALKAGDHIYITGTVSLDEKGSIFAPGEAYEQAKNCLKIIESTLLKFDVPCAKIVRTRMFVTDISQWKAFGRAHHEFFEQNPPTTSMLEVQRLIDPDLLVEIEAEAYVGRL